MDFKDLTIEDKDTIEEYFAKYGRIHCDVSFAVNFCSRDRYHQEWCMKDGFLVLRLVSDDRTIQYCQPIGDGDGSSLIPFMEMEAETRGTPLVLFGLTPSFVQRMRERYSDWGFFSDRRFADYVYRASDLRNLPGKKYQQKRNHVNKFKSLYDYHYEILCKDNFEDCLQLESRWIREKLLKGESISENQMVVDLEDELSYIRTAFDHYEILELIGGALYVGDKLVAFSFGSLSGNVFYTHVEKADTEYEGAFSMMNRQLALHLPGEVEFIDREWDGGIAGLREAKLQYHPSFLSEDVFGRKFSSEEMQVRDLWLRCFPEDSMNDADEFIMKHSASSRLFSHKEDGRIVSSLYIVPFKETAYLYAAMTDLQYRGRGFFRALFTQAVSYCRDCLFERILLIPADPSIASWYRRQGFRGNYHVTFRNDDGYDFGTGDRSKDYGCLLQLNDKSVPPDGEIALTYN